MLQRNNAARGSHYSTKKHKRQPFQQGQLADKETLPVHLKRLECTQQHKPIFHILPVLYICAPIQRSPPQAGIPTAFCVGPEPAKVGADCACRFVIYQNQQIPISCPLFSLPSIFRFPPGTQHATKRTSHTSSSTAAPSRTSCPLPTCCRWCTAIECTPGSANARMCAGRGAV